MDLDITTIDKLKEHLELKDAEIDKLKKEVQDIGDLVVMKKYNEELNEKALWTNEKAEEFGRILKNLAMTRNSTQWIGGTADKLAMEEGEKVALGTMLIGDAATGSYVTPTQYIDDILRLASYKTALRALVNKVNMTARTAVIPKAVTEFTFNYLSTESADVTEQNPTFTTETLTSYNYAGYIPCSYALVEDSLVNLGNYFAEIMSSALAKKFDSEFLTGSGSPTTGILEDSSVLVHTMASGQFDDIDADDLVNCLKLLTKKEQRRNAHWIMHITIADMIFSLRNANGDYIFRGEQYLTRGIPSKLLGHPIVISDEMPDNTETAVSTKFIALGDPKIFNFGDRESLNIRLLDRTSYFATNLELLWVAWFRSAFNVGRPADFATIQTAAS